MEKDIILDSIADGVFTVDHDWRVTSFNRAAEQITGVRREEAIGKRCKDVPKADVCEKGCILRETMQSGKSIVNRIVHIVDAAGRQVPISISTALLKDENGLIIGAVETFRDISVEEKLRKAIAERGTLFLDEIGDISPALQVRLLRVLQEKTYEPLGAVESVPSDVRIITATNRRLQNLVREGKFREDLYYRINVIRMELPPLRDRLEDIPLLADHFIRHFNILQKKEISGLSGETLACLVSYNYPGNVRELENIIEHAFILCKSGLIEPHHLPENLCLPRSMVSTARNEALSMKDLEAVFITNMLRQHHWNRIRTTKALGIHKSTLFRKIKALHIQIPAPPEE